MKMKKLLTSLFLGLWIFSSFGAGPSKQIILHDSFGGEPSNSVREVIGMDVKFSGKMASAAQGNLMLLLDEPVLWTFVDAEGASQSIEASIFECNPRDGAVVGAYPLAPVKTEGDEEPEAMFGLDDLVFDAVNGVYYGINSEKKVLYAFEYGPDQPVTVMVEKTRMVEVVIPPDSLLAEVEKSASVEPETASVQEEATTEAAAEVEPETESAAELEAVVTETVPSEAPAVETEEEAAAEAADTTAASEIPQPEAEKTINVKPVEVEAILEEVEEVIVPKTKWVEETYEEPTTVMESHKFGSAVAAYDLSDLALETIGDLFFDDVDQALVMLGKDKDANWMLVSLQPNGVKMAPVGDPIHFDVNGNVESMFVDSLTHHWMVITADAVEMHARDGRLLRTIKEQVNFSDVCSVITQDADGKTLRTPWVATASSYGPLEWTRSGEEKVHHVPGEFATIQSAIDVAKKDDWILLSPGQYAENLTMKGKTVNLVSYFQFSEDLYFQQHTLIAPESGVALSVSGPEGTSVYVSGVRMTGAETAVISSGNLTVENSEIIGNGTGILFSGGTAMIADCEISGNSSDGILYRDATASLIERCNLSENGGHGISVTITPYDGVLYRTVIRRNSIRANQGSGIYFLDRPIMTQREFRIENNFVLENAVAGIEVYLEQPDPKNLIPTGPRTRSAVYLVNNTIVGNPVGVLRGGNYRMVNNIVAQSKQAGVKDLLYNSMIIRNLFWQNEANVITSNFNASNNREEDPLFVGSDFILSVRSPAKKAGIPGNLWNDTSDRSGADIGASR